MFNLIIIEYLYDLANLLIVKRNNYHKTVFQITSIIVNCKRG